MSSRETLSSVFVAVAWSCFRSAWQGLCWRCSVKLPYGRWQVMTHAVFRCGKGCTDWAEPSLVSCVWCWLLAMMLNLIPTKQSVSTRRRMRGKKSRPWPIHSAGTVHCVNKGYRWIGLALKKGNCRVVLSSLSYSFNNNLLEVYIRVTWVCH